MQKLEKLFFGNFYHIYNRGINSCNLFRDPENYKYFLDLYDKYITPIADTYAWVLMPNHFHFLLRLKEEEEILSQYNGDGQSEPGSLKKPHQYFSNCFNAYSKALNKHYHRHGALFERPFCRKKIDTQDYLRQAILYIHHNPVHHGYRDHPMDYPWSSYLTCISIKPTKLHRQAVIGWFDSMANFKTCHEQDLDIDEIESWLMEGG